ncbi:TolC family protein [Desulfovibrio sp. OttesenSCG-928-F07]|nr:TolC family protein [Desulfovibrio sp. OttesenSCG-928-F07]
MRIRVTLLLLVLSLCTALPLKAEQLEYKNALALVLSTHGNVKAAEQNIERFKHEASANTGLHLPTLSVDAKYTHMNDELALKASLPVMGFPVNINLPVQDQDFLRATANISWPLFTGGAQSAAVSAGQARYSDSQADFDMLQNNLAHDFTDKYFALQLAHEAAALRREVYQSLKQHYENTIRKEKVGMVPKVESMHAEVSLNDALRNYNQALRDIEIASAALKSLLPVTGEPVPVTPLFVLPPDKIEPLEHFITSSQQHSPSAKKLEHMAELAKAGVSASRATYMPTLYAYGSYELYRDDLTMLDPDWFIGIGANWKLFEGGTGHNKYMAAKSTERQVAHKSEQTKKDLATLSEVYYRQLEKAWEQYSSAAGTLDFTREYLRVRTKAFEGGFATSLDVVDAETALSKNRLDILVAAYEFDIALSRLLALAGEHKRFDQYINSIYAKIAK